MSLILADSFSRYGTTEASSTASFLGRYGWSGGGNLHNRTGSLFGANHFQQSGGAQSSKTAYWSTIGRSIVPSNSLGLSLKCCPFSFRDSGSGTTYDYLFIRINLSNGHYIDLNLGIQVFHNNTFVTNSVWTTNIYAMYFTYNSSSDIRNAANSALPGRRIDFTGKTASVYSRPASRDMMWTANFSTVNWMHLDFLFNTTTKIFSARLVSHDNDVFSTTTTDPNPRYGSIAIPNGLTINSISLYGSDNSGMKMSDLILWTQDSTGLSKFPDSPRNLRVQRLLPEANGTFNTWTPNTGANFSAINETPYSDSQYSEGVGIGSKQTFVMNPLGSGVNSIKSAVYGIQLNPSIQDVGGNVSVAAPIQVIGGTETALVSGIAPSRVSYTVPSRVITINPQTSLPYTAAQINAMETGFNVQ